MNLERLDQAIQIMKRAGRVNMNTWNESGSNTEEEMHACGSAACFAGWVAISPEFQEVGGKMDPINKYPVFNTKYWSYAITEWLEVESFEVEVLFELLVYGNHSAGTHTRSEDLANKFYKKGFDVFTDDYALLILNDWADYTAEDVVTYLEKLKELTINYNVQSD